MTEEQREDARHWTSDRFQVDDIAASLCRKLLPFAMDALDAAEAEVKRLQAQTEQARAHSRLLEEKLAQEQAARADESLHLVCIGCKDTAPSSLFSQLRSMGWWWTPPACSPDYPYLFCPECKQIAREAFARDPS